MRLRLLVRALTTVAPVLAVGLPLGYQEPVIHPAPAVWRTALLGRPGPAAPGWPRPSITIRDAQGDTEYRWGVIPADLTRAGAFLDAATWTSDAVAARRNAQARADSARGDGGNIMALLRVQTSVAPTAWVRGYDTPTHCTLLGGETYRNVQFTIALYSDHRPRTCAPERRWMERALRLLWGQADAYGRAATVAPLARPVTRRSSASVYPSDAMRPAMSSHFYPTAPSVATWG